MQVNASSQPNEQVGTPTDLLYTYVLVSIGFGCMISWNLIGIFSPALSVLSYAPLSEAFIMRVIAVGSITVTYAVCVIQSNWVFEHRLGLTALTTALSLAVVLNAGLHQFFDVPTGFSIISWVLFGIGDSILCIVWCAYLSLIPTRRTGVTIAIGSIVGTLLFVVAASIGHNGVSLLAMACLPLASLSMLIFLFQQLSPAKIEAAKSYPKASVLGPAAALSVGAHGVIYGFITLLMCLISAEAAIIVGASGILCCIVAAILSYRAPSSDFDNSLVQRVSLPVIVIGLLLLPLLDESGQIFCGCLVNNALAFTAVTTRSTLSIENSEFHLHPIARYAERQTPMWIGFLVGAVIAVALMPLSSLNHEIFVFLAAILASFVVAAFSLYGADDSKTQKQLEELLTVDSTQEQEESAQHFPQYFHQRCEKVSERFDLSPREAEIFVLLAKGRNAKFIQEELCISSSTVKTHIYRIYRKMNINSQQLLIDAVDAEDKR